MKKIISNRVTRVDFSYEELHKQNQINTDFFMQFKDNGLGNFINLHNNSNDEIKLYELWKKSENIKDYLDITHDNMNEAHKLMNHGYLILNNQKFQLTEKGKKVIVNKSLSESPENIYKKSNSVHKLIKKCIKKTTEAEELGEVEDKDSLKTVNVNGKLVPRIPKNKVKISNIDTNSYDNTYKQFPYEQTEMATWQENIQSSDWDTDVKNINPIKDEIKSNPKKTNNNLKKQYSDCSNSKLFGLLKTSSMNKNEIVEEFKNRKLKVALVADKEDLQQKGLMFHPGLKKEECALFIFDKPNNYSFWNKNVSFPIDVAFFNSKGKLISISNLKENQLNSVGAQNSDVKYVIETNLNWFKDNKINVGDSIYDVLENL